MQALARVAAGMAALALGGPGRGAHAQGTQPGGTPGSEPPTKPDPSTIVLAQPLVEAEPAVFARRLSALLGAEVRLPQGQRGKITIPAGAWSPEELLEQVAQALSAARQSQGRSYRAFVLKSAGTGPPAPPSKLKVGARVTVHERDARVERIADEVVGAQAGWRVELPAGLSGRYAFDCTNLPVREALAALAARAGLSVREAVGFEFGAGGIERPDRGVQDSLAEQEAGSQGLLAELALLGQFTDLTGADPLDPGFDWNAIGPGVWAALGLGPDGVAGFQEWVGDIVQGRDETEARSLEMLAGALGEMGNVNLETGQIKPPTEDEPR